MDLPVYTTLNGLCRHAGVNRSVIHRLMGQDILKPDGQIELRNERQPIFLVEAVRQILPHLNPPRRKS
jgi:hypothetical protein